MWECVVYGLVGVAVATVCERKCDICGRPGWEAWGCFAVNAILWPLSMGLHGLLGWRRDV